MKLQRHPIALAVLAMSGAFPMTAEAAPTISWSAPSSGATLYGAYANSTACQATASGANRVKFYVDAREVNTDNTAPFQCAFDTRQYSVGTHTLKAIAIASDGSTATVTRSVTFASSAPAANAAPNVSFTSPGAGATVSGTVTYAVNAIDDKGVNRVVFTRDGGVALATDTASPFSGTLDTRTLANGSHVITATAYDAEGLSRSASVTINVNNVVNTAPSVLFTSPTATAQAGTITYSATGTDDKAVTRVVFKLDGSTIADKTAAPWSGSIDTRTLSNASHTLTATAYDAEGLNNTATVTFPVSNTATSTTTTPPPGSGTLDVWFKSPKTGNTVSGVLTGTTCYVAGNGITRVAFYLDGNTLINTDTVMSDGMQCVLDTTRIPNGTHSLTATATSSTGSTRSDVISINVQNAATTPPPATNAAPTVSFTSPAAGAASGSVNFAANAADDKAVTRVVFKVDGTTILDKTAAPWSGSLDTRTLSNAAHSLTATAYDAEGLNATATVSLTVNNASTTPPSTGGLPSDSTGVRGAPTFHSIGLYWASPGATSATGCKVQFRKQGESTWRDGLDMWFDSRNSECRSSLVRLDPATVYEVQMGLPGQAFKKGLAVKTWSEQFPVAQTITLPAGTVTQPLVITQGGTASGYILYQANPAGTTIDVQNAYDNNVTISAPYVIVRGVTMKNARIHGVDLRAGSHDVVIEGNDISGWGRYMTTSSNTTGLNGWQIGVDMDSGIMARCPSSGDATRERFIIQRNRIHDPRYGAGSWDWGHPMGPQGITFSYCGGNHVIRYNEITSSDYRHYYNDGIGGEDNFTTTGFPNYDTDIYGNLIQGVMDDAIEAEGGNKNVRIWGNYLDQTGTGIASTVAHWGPLYIFNNVYDRSRKRYALALDSDDRGPFFKSGTKGGYGDGRRYVFHNTSLQATQSGATNGLGAGTGLQGQTGEPLTNTVARNNVIQVWKSGWQSFYQTSTGYNNDVNYDLYNGTVSAQQGAESNGVRTVPTYQPGNGVGASGLYQLAPGTPGSGTGVRLPNFNDAHATPDMGAHQAGTPAMKFGVSQ